MTEVLRNSLKSMQWLFMVAFVVDNVGDSHAGTENEDVASERVILHASHAVTHDFFNIVGLQHHNISVAVDLLSLQVQYDNTASKRGCHD